MTLRYNVALFAEPIGVRSTRVRQFGKRDCGTAEPYRNVGGYVPQITHLYRAKPLPNVQFGGERT
jgi:hypothetical protein